jgi:alkaline phosphatase D
MARALAVANNELAPHLSFADLGGHGYAVVTAKPAELDVEFVCLPRPLERSAGADGGELAYRVAFHVPRWDSRDGPRVIRSSVTGSLPLIP